MVSGRPIVVIVGPTASGKSELAQILAETLNGEVISADSMQIYKHLNIGTGKLKEGERRVPHFGLDIVEPNEPYSAALFQEYARGCIEDIRSRNHQPILCGGTGFYIKSVIDDYNFSEGNQQENAVREHFQRIAENLTNEELWLELKKLDEESASEIEVNDVKRVIRALELNARGESYAQNKAKLKDISEFLPSVWIGLKVDRDVLAKRISKRVDKMIEEGLVDEVKNLISMGFRDALCSPKAIGYREIIEHLDGKKTLEQAICDIKTNSRRYAKRQRTWFRSEARIHWVDANIPNFDEIASESLSIVSEGF